MLALKEVVKAVILNPGCTLELFVEHIKKIQVMVTTAMACLTCQAPCTTCVLALMRVGAVVTLILQMWKPRLREVYCFPSMPARK